MSLSLSYLRELSLLQASASGRPAYLSAASGLVKLESGFYVVGDDELSLARFPLQGDAPGELLSLFEGHLPDEPAARKRQKPDLEALLHLRADELPPFGGLLTVPSGSRANRSRGAIVTLLADDEPDQEAIAIDFAPLFALLASQFPELNIEGALARGGRLKLFQRGNGSSGQNAVIDLSLLGLLEDLRARRPLTGRLLEGVTYVELGRLNGVPLGFTDAALDPENRIWFLAAAEKTESVYDDGEYAGAVLGSLNDDGSLGRVFELNCPQKPEGLVISRAGDLREFFLVTDADHAASPSRLYRGMIPEGETDVSA